MVFLIVAVFILFNLLLAVFYNNYKERVSNEMTQFESVRQNYFNDKFEEMDLEAKGYITT